MTAAAQTGSAEKRVRAEKLVRTWWILASVWSTVALLIHVGWVNPDWFDLSNYPFAVVPDRTVLGAIRRTLLGERIFAVAGLLFAVVGAIDLAKLNGATRLLEAEKRK